MDKICLFDLDGTLADYEGSMRGVLKEINPPDFEVPLDLYNAPEYVQKQMDLIKNKPGFWENLKPLKAGFEILQIAQAIGYTIMVLSKGPGKCATGCLVSNTEYLPEMEGNGWEYIVQQGMAPAAHQELISDLQHIHDMKVLS